MNFWFAARESGQQSCGSGGPCPPVPKYFSAFGRKFRDGFSGQFSAARKAFLDSTPDERSLLRFRDRVFRNGESYCFREKLNTIKRK
jgi:hypothetical protein